MKTKLLKIILPIIGIGIISSSVVSLTSCSQNGLSPATISKIMQVYQGEAKIQSSADSNILDVGYINAEFPQHTPKDVDVDSYASDNPNDENYKKAVADAETWEKEITAPMKTWINNNVKAGKDLSGKNDDPVLAQIDGYSSFREDYFTIHVANIFAQTKDANPSKEWIFKSTTQNTYKSFTCLQNAEDNDQYKKNSHYTGSEFSTIRDGQPKQVPDYLDGAAIELQNFYQEMNLPYLWSIDLWQDKQPIFNPYLKHSDDSFYIVSINYLVSFSPKPWDPDSPPVAFYVRGDLRCSGIGG